MREQCRVHGEWKSVKNPSLRLVLDIPESYFIDVDKMLGSIPVRESMMVKERYIKYKYWAVIAREFNISADRVRRMCGHGMRKLRHPTIKDKYTEPWKGFNKSCEEIKRMYK